ncbi:ferric reductase-like transmembrane domain-containing protein [Paraclostridium ghonii]|uniref:ferric reductase-like transmembrane domain-containing protein n=1 Tax=Paraclostridium ghonii TaxID=29358 RepID=UPI00202CA975|nr:ferric reductase-like transmembrane domain-containing protein [Paeniclostridium ghonii]MCM0167554.1 ferric reductase-like transmembrane domain-containing protein [Paeniclostridium ghonii]
MRLVYSLIFVAIFALIFTTTIRKHSKIFYSIASVISGITIIYEIYRLISDTKLQGFIGELEKAFMKGNVAIAFFLLVMFAGALNPKWKLTKKLLSIRAEAAILGCILLLPHGVMYLVRFINKILLHKPITILYIIYLIIGLIAFIIMIPLFITSLKKVRSKMSYADWKKIQRWAYPFYLLSYVHIVLALLNDEEIDIMKLSIYTIGFVGYFSLKMIKNYKLKNKTASTIN